MTLKEYLNKSGMTQVAFAKMAGISTSFLSLLLSDERHPSPETAARIERATKNKVTRLELLYPDEDHSVF